MVVDIEMVDDGVLEYVKVARAVVSEGERAPPRHSLLAPKMAFEVIAFPADSPVVVMVHPVAHFPGKVRPNLNVRANT